LAGIETVNVRWKIWFSPPEDLRSEAQRRIEADRALCENKRRRQSPLTQIEAGLLRPYEAPPGLAGWVAWRVLNVPEAGRDSFVGPFGRLLTVSLEQRSTLWCSKERPAPRKRGR
jgi:hypothetical protein